MPVDRGATWIKAVMHALACNGSACTLGACAGAKTLLTHVFSTSFARCNAGCEVPGCVAVRQLCRHWVSCPRDAPCTLCSGLWNELQDDMSMTQGRYDPDGSSCTSALTTGSEEPMSTTTLPDPTPAAPATRVHQEAASPASAAWDVQGHTSVESQGTASDVGLGTPDAGHRTPSGTQHDDVVAQVVAFANLLITSFIEKGGMPEAHAVDDTESDQRMQWAVFAHDLWHHVLSECPMTSCCQHPGCGNARAVLMHLVTCKVHDCPVCVPVSQHFSRTVEPLAQGRIDAYLVDLGTAIMSLRL